METTRSPSALADIQPAPSASAETLTRLDTPKVDSPTLAIQELPAGVEASSGSPLVSNLRRWSLLALFSCAQFFDIYLSSASILSLTSISNDLGLIASEATWLINAYTLTLAAGLLAAGRVSDMFSAKWTFVIGLAWVGFFSMGVGFSRNKTTIIVLRAFTGIGASATIPSAIRLIVNLFTDPTEQALALSIFGGTGAIALVIGGVLGGVLLLASWSWVYYLVTLVTVPAAVLAALLIPSRENLEQPLETEEKAISTPSTSAAPTRKPKMDGFGLFILTSGLVLLVFGLSNGNVAGWKKAQTLAPLIIGIVLTPCFFLWELCMDPFDALIDPSAWRIKNFLLLTVIALFPYYWWFSYQAIFSERLQRDWDTSAIMTAVHFLPNAFAGGAPALLYGYIPSSFSLRWRLIVGGTCAAGGGLMLAFMSRKDLYWPLMFPGFLIGSSGMCLVYVTANVGLILSVPPSRSGVVGGTFNTALQLGASIGLAISTAIQVQFPSEADHLIPSSKGYFNSMMLTVACSALIVPLTVLFFKDPLAPSKEDTADTVA